MSDQDKISPHNIKQTSDENKEKYKLGDQIPNSHTSCTTDSKENYLWYIRSYKDDNNTI